MKSMDTDLLALGVAAIPSVVFMLCTWRLSIRIHGATESINTAALALQNLADQLKNLHCPSSDLAEPIPDDRADSLR